MKLEFKNLHRHCYCSLVSRSSRHQYICYRCLQYHLSTQILCFDNGALCKLLKYNLALTFYIQLMRILNPVYNSSNSDYKQFIMRRLFEQTQHNVTCRYMELTLKSFIYVTSLENTTSNFILRSNDVMM
jgi:hypothetical protein